jgi:hypothetical protein
MNMNMNMNMNIVCYSIIASRKLSFYDQLKRIETNKTLSFYEKLKKTFKEIPFTFSDVMSIGFVGGSINVLYNMVSSGYLMYSKGKFKIRDINKKMSLKSIRETILHIWKEFKDRYFSWKKIKKRLKSITKITLVILSTMGFVEYSSRYFSLSVKGKAIIKRLKNAKDHYDKGRKEAAYDDLEHVRKYY